MRRNRNLFVVIIITTFCWCMLACGHSAEVKKNADERYTQDSIEAAQRMADSLAAMEAAMMPADSTVTVDSVVSIGPEDEEGTEAPATAGRHPSSVNEENAEPVIATLCYSYFTEMVINESKDINVVVNLDSNQELILDEIRTLVEDQEVTPFDKIEKDSQSCVRISLYDSLLIRVIDRDDAFVIIPQTDTLQKVERNGSTCWRWTINPRSGIKVKEPKLTIKVRAIFGSHSSDKIKDKDIKINVSVNRNLCWRTINYISDNPSVFLSLLVIPLIKFLYERWKERKSK